MAAAAPAGGGGRGRTRNEALSRADLQILLLWRQRPRRAGASGRAGSGYTGLGRGRPWGAARCQDPLPSRSRAAASGRPGVGSRGRGAELLGAVVLKLPPRPPAAPRSRRSPSPARGPPVPLPLPFRRKAPLSAARRVESAPGPRRFRQWGWTAISALGRFHRRGSPRPATLLPELAGLGLASRGAPWGSEFANFRGARGRSARVGGPPQALGAGRLRRAPAEPPRPAAEGELRAGERSQGASDAVTFLRLPGLGPAGRGGGSLSWGRLGLARQRLELAPLAFFSVGEHRRGFRTSVVGATPANRCVNVCPERAEPRGSESARVCKELLCVWYFEKMAECLFQSGMPPPRQALVAAAHRNSCSTLGFRAMLGRSSGQTLKFP